MVRPVILFYLVFAIASVRAQATDTTIAVVHYSLVYIPDTTMRESPNTDDLVLFIGKKSSLNASYTQMMSEQRVKAAMAQYPDVVLVGTTYMYGVPNMFYKGMPGDKLYSIASFQGNKYIIEENTPVFDWKISEEARNIKGYKCQKTTTFFRGRTYEVWFTPELPFSTRPWKLAGLPGLIPEACDKEKEYVFSFTSFEGNDTSHRVIELPSKTIKSTHKEIYQSVFAVQNDAVPANVAGATKLLGPQTASEHSRKKRFNNPLEKYNNK